MTYTLLARCPKTGQVGIGIATYSICVGLYCNGLRGNVGAAMTQAFVNQGNNTLALNLLAQGFSPTHVLDELKANDPDAEYRQIAIIDHAGREAGGQVGNEGHLTERSAAVRVYGEYDHAELDLRVDLHDQAVDELRRAFEEYELYRGYYRDRGKNPRNAISQAEFVARLAQREAAQ